MSKQRFHSTIYPSIHPLISFEHLSLYIQKHSGQSVAVCGSLWKLDHGRPRQSQIQPGTVGYSQARPGTVLKRPIMCYILEKKKEMLWGYQIWYWEACLGHAWDNIKGILSIMDNHGQQSAVLHASVMPFLGPRGPLGTPSFVRTSARPRKKSGSTVQLYKSTKDHCQPIRYCLVRVWWCLVVSG